MTKEKILKAGIKAWLEDANSVTAANIARKLNMTHPAILYHFKNVKDAVAAYAVETGENRIIVQLVTMNHPAVQKMTSEEKLKVYSHFTSGEPV